MTRLAFSLLLASMLGAGSGIAADSRAGTTSEVIARIHPPVGAIAGDVTHAGPNAPLVAGDSAPPSRWQATFDAFAEADRTNPPPPGGVLFVGSSSIRLWTDLEHQFRNLPIVKRGFGGSQLSDCVKHLSRLVIRYRPRTVLVYAGDNDLAAGSNPQEVLRRFTRFVDGVRRELPDTRIAFISIKPSPSRRMLLPEVQATNRLIESYVTSVPNLDFIDVFTPMMDTKGNPRPELFRADALHLNADGYALWTRVISRHVH